MCDSEFLTAKIQAAMEQILKSQLPDAGYVESVLAAMERYPFATLSSILLVVAVGYCIAVFKRKV